MCRWFCLICIRVALALYGTFTVKTGESIVGSGNGAGCASSSGAGDGDGVGARNIYDSSSSADISAASTEGAVGDRGVYGVSGADGAGASGAVMDDRPILGDRGTGGAPGALHSEHPAQEIYVSHTLLHATSCAIARHELSHRCGNGASSCAELATTHATNSPSRIHRRGCCGIDRSEVDC